MERNNITVEFALRDEKVNIWAMTFGASFLRNEKLIMLCKKEMIPQKRTGPFLLTAKKTLGFSLSDEGNAYHQTIISQDFPLSFISFVDSYLKIKIDKAVFDKLYNSRFFSIWNPNAPFKYFEGKAIGYLSLFRVFRIQQPIDQEIITRGSKGRNYYFRLNEPITVTISEAVINDSTFTQMKTGLIDLLQQDGSICEVHNNNYLSFQQTEGVKGQSIQPKLQDSQVSTQEKAIHNPPWQRDELILALDLYFRHNPSHINQKHEEVIKLSNILNTLPIHPDHSSLQRFRNPNGVYMKLCNFLCYDPSYRGKGLERGNKLEKMIWKEFASDPAYLHKVAEGIIQGLQFDGSSVSVSEEDEEVFPEGKVLYRQHRSRERNRSLIQRAKEEALLKGELKCVICNFDFYERYGELGKGYIECHHTVPVSEYHEGMVTKVKDLALVCANCHRMLHRRRPWLTIEELSSILSS